MMLGKNAYNANSTPKTRKIGVSSPLSRKTIKKGSLLTKVKKCKAQETKDQEVLVGQSVKAPEVDDNGV